MSRSRPGAMRSCVISATRQGQDSAWPEWRGSLHGRVIQTAWWQRRHSIPARVKVVHREGISEGRARAGTPRSMVGAGGVWWVAATPPCSSTLALRTTGGRPSVVLRALVSMIMALMVVCVGDCSSELGPRIRGMQKRFSAPAAGKE